jgi:hypothetical protein
MVLRQIFGPRVANNRAASGWYEAHRRHFREQGEDFLPTSRAQAQLRLGAKIKALGGGNLPIFNGAQP